MVPFSKYRRLFVATGSVIVSGGTCFQVYQTYYGINQMFKSDVLELEKKRAEYIYIHDPKFKDKVCCMINDDEEVKQSTRDVFDLPMKWWKSWKHSYAWRLLSMAKYGDHSERLTAVRTLSSLKSLNDSDFKQIAQVCDERTAVGLARSAGVDLRFFLPPPYVHVTHNRQELTDRFHTFLIELQKKKRHACVGHFIKQAFPKIHQRHLNLHDDLVPTMESPKQVIRTEDVLPMCIQNLLHHSNIKENAKDIITLGGLPFLMDLYRHFKDNTEILIMLAKVISNISNHPGMLQTIFESGWIGVLARFAQNTNINLSAPAARALANMDDDEQLSGTYLRHIYLLHPAARSLPTCKMDVVFIHGLLGGAFITWRQRDRPCANDHVTKDKTQLPVVTSDAGTIEYLENVTEVKVHEWEEIMHDYEMVMADCPESTNGQAKGPYTYTGTSAHRVCNQAHADKECYTSCWPKDWLPNDCRCLRIIGVNYITSITQWNPSCPEEKYSGTLVDRSDELLNKLKSAGLGQRPIVWVTHSMGGLIVKSLLVKAWSSDDTATKSLSSNTKGVIFYSCPHQGSPVARLAPNLMLISPTLEVQQLKENSPQLASLHSEFLEMLEENPMTIISFAETKLTEFTSLRLKFNFVPLHSADPGVGEFFAIPQDHLGICKPASRQSFLYQKVLHLINDCISSTKV